MAYNALDTVVEVDPMAPDGGLRRILHACRVHPDLISHIMDSDKCDMGTAKEFYRMFSSTTANMEEETRHWVRATKFKGDRLEAQQISRIREAFIKTQEAVELHRAQQKAP